MNRDLLLVLLILAGSIGGFVKYGSQAGWVGLACVCFILLLAFGLREIFGCVMRLVKRK